MTKQDKTTNKSKPSKKQRSFNGIIGLLQLFVVASVAYSTAVIVMGTEGYIPWALVAPQALWAVCVLVKRFSK